MIGQSWNIGAIQSAAVPVGNTQEVSSAEFIPPVWDDVSQTIEADFGGQWDTAINEVSFDNSWTTVVRKARSNRDLRPIRSMCCDYLHSIERAGKPIKCINEVSNDHGNWEKITVTIDQGQLIP